MAAKKKAQSAQSKPKRSQSSGAPSARKKSSAKAGDTQSLFNAPAAQSSQDLYVSSSAPAPRSGSSAQESGSRGLSPRIAIIAALAVAVVIAIYYANKDKDAGGDEAPGGDAALVTDSGSNGEIRSNDPAPAENKPEESKPEERAPVAGARSYTVVGGDTGLAIQRKTGVPWRQIHELNKDQINAGATNLKPGMVLKLPAR
jgi:LysM repeat protein